jgi:hypothetical protein
MANRAFLDALLKVAEDPNRPGTVDPVRLERWLASVEGIAVNGMKIVRKGRDASGDQTWALAREH